MTQTDQSPASKKPAATRQAQSLVARVAHDNEKGARQALLEELFYDFHRSRRQVYWLNFWRGFFFGIGSIVGVTLLVTLSVWLLGRFADVFPALADFLNQLIDTMQRRR